ncbi:MAG TPA: histidine phosphatase family protein, partial [Gemmatimonadaceae bacterium]|nr:histidine phosphatase family protein [Gemmatimonadaceae bacterium]
MDLLLVRHADAGDPAAFSGTGRPDDERPLSQRGEEQMRMAAVVLRDLLPGCGTVVSSPLRRAVQTAELLGKAYGLAAPIQTRALIPGVPLMEFVEWMTRFDETQCVAAVGHEPHLSELATWLSTGARESRIQLKKGAACLITFTCAVRAGDGTLQWLLQPRQLERLSASTA